MTFVSTLALQLEFAIFVGVLASLFVYLNRTTHPRLTDGDARPGVAASPVQRGDGEQPVPRPQCPQLALLRVDGSLFFGAVEHVRDELERDRARRRRRAGASC